MVKYKHESSHQRTRMAYVIGLRCGGYSIHRDSNLIRKEIDLDLNAMGGFLMFLRDTGTFKNQLGYEMFSRWCSKNEVTWMDEWKKWSKNLENK